MIEAELSDPVRCNCSICRRRGAVMVYVESDKFELLEGGGNQVHYKFRSDAGRASSFCSTCGLFPFFHST